MTVSEYPHDPTRAAGCPFYSPFPDTIKVPSMLTPKRANNLKDRGGKKDEDKDEPEGKKGKKEGKRDPTQKKLVD